MKGYKLAACALVSLPLLYSTSVAAEPAWGCTPAVSYAFVEPQNFDATNEYKWAVEEGDYIDFVVGFSGFSECEGYVFFDIHDQSDATWRGLIPSAVAGEDIRHRVEVTNYYDVSRTDIQVVKGAHAPVQAIVPSGTDAMRVRVFTKLDDVEDPFEEFSVFFWSTWDRSDQLLKDATVIESHENPNPPCCNND